MNRGGRFVCDTWQLREKLGYIRGDLMCINRQERSRVMVLSEKNEYTWVRTAFLEPTM